jgi:hypothetical protein
MKDRTAARLAGVVFGFIALSFLGAVAFSVLNATAPHASGWDPAPAVSGLAVLSFPLVGMLIARRHPRNAVCWILLAIGLVWESGDVSAGYVRYAFVTNPGSLPRPDLVAVVTSSFWIPAIGLMGTFLILLFPDGRLPSPRWKPMGWLSALVLIGLTVVIPVLPAPVTDFTDIDVGRRVPNPLGIEALRPVLNAVFGLVLLVPLCIAGCALGLITRFRRSAGHERLQLKWLATAASVAATIYFVMMVLSFVVGSDTGDGSGDSAWLNILQHVAVFSFLLIPMAIGIAILRYRLYDIDLIINRALVYVGLTASLALVYTGGVVGIGTLVRTLTRQESDDLVVAASTLAVAGLFGPLRRKVQSFIDRRFYRRKYDAEQTLAQFSARLRDQIDLAALNAEVVAVVTSTMQPSHVSVWVKPPSSGSASP